MRRMLTGCVCGLLLSVIALNGGAAFFPKEFRIEGTVQSMPVAQCSLRTFYFIDTTRSAVSGYTPLTLSLGIDFALLFGYVHSVPKLIFETSVGGDGEGFWGVGGAIAFKVHPLNGMKYNPYLFLDFGYLNMSGGGYDGVGYHFDVGSGFVYPLKKTIKVSPFIAYTPVSQWMRRRQVGYILINPSVGPEPGYEGRLCRHTGWRVGLSFLFNVFGE